MHVLHVMEATVGGTRRHLLDVARGHRRLGLEVTVVASAEREPDFRSDLEALRAEGCWVHELPMVRPIRPATDWRHYRALRAILAARAPDVVHTHSSKAGVLGRRASLATGVGARVHTPHTFAFLFHAMFGPARRVLFRAVEGRLARRTHAIVAVSESEAESFRASGVVPPERVRVVPNGIDPTPWFEAAPADRAALGVPEGVPLLIVVGLLNAAKGQDDLLRALARTRAGAHLLLAGSGETEPELRALAGSLGLAPRVHFLGQRSDVPALLAAADALVLPSRWEGMPYVVLEAMAAGLPVVATAVDGARDLVRAGQTGWLVPVGAPDALAAALDELAEADPQRRLRMGRAGRARVQAEFGLDAMLRGLVRVYEEVA